MFFFIRKVLRASWNKAALSRPACRSVRVGSRAPLSLLSMPAVLFFFDSSEAFDGKNAIFLQIQQKPDIKKSTNKIYFFLEIENINRSAIYFLFRRHQYNFISGSF
jgi:hypothetical protein